MTLPHPDYCISQTKCLKFSYFLNQKDLLVYVKSDKPFSRVTIIAMSENLCSKNFKTVSLLLAEIAGLSLIGLMNPYIAFVPK